MKDAGLTQVDAWTATGGKPVAEMVVPVIRPRTYIPSHWDGLAVKRRLGFSDEQKFSRAVTDTVMQVASTSVGDDCGEGFQAPSPWANALARLQQAGAD